jgi:hypothetical protein
MTWNLDSRPQQIFGVIADFSRAHNLTISVD